jgi:hypothetical protein
MRRLTILVVLVLGALAIVAWRAAPTAITSHLSDGGTTIGVASVHGSYAFSDTVQDPWEEGGVVAGPGGGPSTGQLTAAVGTLRFDGAGGLTGVYTQNTRGCFLPCGYLEVTRVPFDGSYTVYSDGSVTMDFCLHIPTTLNPPQAMQNVHAVWEGAFSTLFLHLRFIQTRIGDCAAPAAALGVSPNVTQGTADKL